MSTRVWRRFLLGLCALALLSIPVDLWMFPSFGTPQWSGVSLTSGTPAAFKIAVKHDAPAYRLGLRTGDVFDARPSPADRYRLFGSGAWPAGQSLVLRVRRGGGIHVVALPITKRQSPMNWDVLVYYAGAFWVVLFATLVTWRRADSVEARTLVLVLILSILSTALARNNWITGSAVVDTVASGLSMTLQAIANALFASYAMLFARPPSRLRRLLAWASYASAGLAAVYDVGLTIAVWAGKTDPFRTAPVGAVTGDQPDLVLWVLSALFPLLCVFAGIAQARGAERARISWGAASVGLIFVGLLTANIGSPISPQSKMLAVGIGNVAEFVAPIGLTYSLLSRRLLDVGFALNRAAVFSVVSLVIVAVFVFAEWLAGEWFRGASHTTNIAISAALALGLGFSVRAIHNRVDRVLDNVFFRKRHEDEKALRSFAHEAAYISNPATLVARAITTLESRADASLVDIALQDGKGCYGNVGEDDPAIVALRAWGKPLDLRNVQTDLRGEFAYPMVARGRLVGALILGPKRSGVSYAPDESDAIAQLSQGVGLALDVLSVKSEGSSDAVLDALRSQGSVLESIRATLVALRDDVLTGRPGA